jgi:A/G-specific adenine glycosylase
MNVSSLLAKWYINNKRELPWRSTQNPYHIWISEIILQQTRVSQGLQYYNRFIEKYPSIQQMADAPLDEILKLWQGLGYYSRARNMHLTARQIVNEYGGQFPRTCDTLIQLKGIGKYTAAAIASLAFNEPVAVVDGNVYRVISRIYALSEPITSATGKKHFEKLAGGLLNLRDPATHNQAMMEFGALVCVPRNPDCQSCVLADGCMAREMGLVHEFPVKKIRQATRLRYFNYLFITHDDHVLIRKRSEKDIWNSLYEFPMIETPEPVTFDELRLKSPWDKLTLHAGRVEEPVVTYNHKLSHQTLVCSFFKANSGSLPESDHSEYIRVNLEDINEYAVPRVIEKFLEEMGKSNQG